MHQAKGENMKIRIMGTKEECDLAAQNFKQIEKDKENVKSVQISQNYPNRGSNTIFRLYVDIEYRERAFDRLLSGGV